MEAIDLQDHYQRLRSELDAAYAAPVWDSQRIDRIADQIVPLEAALARSEHEDPAVS